MLVVTVLKLIQEKFALVCVNFVADGSIGDRRRNDITI